MRPVVSFNDLDPETKGDVVLAVSETTGEDPEDVRIGLENGPAQLPVVRMDPKMVSFGTTRGFSAPTVTKYAAAMRSGAAFPPIIVKRRRGKWILWDGGHRLKAAIRAGVPTVKALDVTDPRVTVTSEGLETYVFLFR